MKLSYNTGKIRKATLEDADYLGSKLRPEDLLEIESFRPNTDPSEALAVGIESCGNRCWTATCLKNKPILIFGVAPVIPEQFGSIWLLGTPRIKEIQWEFLRNCRTILDELHEGFPILGNYVSLNNRVHVKWLKFMGFKFINRLDNFGSLGLSFYEFIHIKN